MTRRSPTAVALVLLLLAGVARAGPDPVALERTQAGARAWARGDLPAAAAAFEAAHARLPADVNGRRNLALVLARQAQQALARRDGATAAALLDRALELHPARLRYEMLRGRALLLAGRGAAAVAVAGELTDRSEAYAEAWLLLADAQERAGSLDEAVDAMERACALRPRDAVLTRRLATLRTRAAAEAGFATHGSGHFVVSYDPQTDAGVVRLALTLLEDAYARVTADLGAAPRTPARVVLYPGREFQRVTSAHAWVGALYQDGVLRVPIRNLERHRGTAARVLAHEFTHHVLRERTPALPVWWHEGIAQHEERDAEAERSHVEDLDRELRAGREGGRLLSLPEIQRTVIVHVADPATVRFFYAQTEAFVGWLVDQEGDGALPALITALGSGTDVDAAVRRAFGEDTATLWQRWLDSL
jgi:tetratricopeptide (TPR) repeat protein